MTEESKAIALERIYEGSALIRMVTSEVNRVPGQGDLTDALTVANRLFEEAASLLDE